METRRWYGNGRLRKGEWVSGCPRGFRSVKSHMVWHAVEQSEGKEVVEGEVGQGLIIISRVPQNYSFDCTPYLAGSVPWCGWFERLNLLHIRETCERKGCITCHGIVPVWKDKIRSTKGHNGSTYRALVGRKASFDERRLVQTLDRWSGHTKVFLPRQQQILCAPYCLLLFIYTYNDK